MNKKHSLVVLAATLALIAAACSGDSSSDTTVTDPPTPDPINLSGTRWVATAMFLGGAPVAFVPNAEPTVDFTDDGRSLGGSTGCNSFFADYTVGGGTISFGGLGQTEMACEEPLM
ncbi:MAG: META domain-containing protein, partial [Acidimicrobiia bacterium]|nr:META domain-containing protein [Acidimicrobiia bacterium]